MNTYYDPEFYPTPAYLISKMVEPHLDELINMRILEPQAGNGAILDYLMQIQVGKRFKVNLNRSKLYAIERDDEMQAVLKGKQYRVLANDFLTYAGGHLFDLILMNPPFSNGDEHLIKAWNIIQNGHIVCLLNAETIRNPYTKRRQFLLKLIEKHGSYEFIENGFLYADRKTNIDIALVRLEKVGQKNPFDYYEPKPAEEFNFEEKDLYNQLTRIDFIDTMVTLHEQSRQAFAEFLTAHSKVCYYADKVLSSTTAKNFISAAMDSANTNNARYNYFLEELTMQAWDTIFNKTSFRKVATTDVRRRFKAHMQEIGVQDFSVNAINDFLMTLLLNKETILNQCIVDVFELMTKYHKKNTVYWEGWKTNDTYKVNRKVIMPYLVELNYSGGFSRYYRKDSDELLDIDRAMCLITGKTLENICTIEDSLKQKSIRATLFEVESEFFYVRCFKKGTAHLIFKDEFIWQEFNLRAAKGKNWLPEADDVEDYTHVKETLQLGIGSLVADEVDCD